MFIEMLIKGYISVTKKLKSAFFATQSKLWAMDGVHKNVH